MNARAVLLLSLLQLPAALAAPVEAPVKEALRCLVEGSDDHFILYPEQQIHQTASHRVYLLIDGLTLAVVNRQTLRFNRLTNLNLQPQPDRLQLFTGRCQAQPP